MKTRLFIAAALLALTGAAGATDVGVSISISQPGVYGRVDIGRFPQPQVVVAQPVIIEQPRVVVAHPQPVYLYVPREHRKNWRKHCRAYQACGTPVMFVRHDWYDGHVMHAHRHGKGHGKGNGRGKGKHDD